MKTKTFKVELDGASKEFLVKSPSLDNQREAQKVYNQAFTDAIKSGSIVRAKLNDLLEQQGLWSPEKEAEFKGLQKEIAEKEQVLARGGISLKDAKGAALEIKEMRDTVRELIGGRTQLDNHSAEGQADNARFNYLVSACVVYSDSKEHYFSSLEDYLNRSTSSVALEGAQNLANMLYGLDNDYEGSLPENKFLKKYRFVDDKLRLIDKRGRLIDSEGRLVDENGRFIDEAGAFVDKFGNRVDNEGDYVFETKPFLDDDGNPVILDEDKNDKQVPPPTSTPEPKPEASAVEPPKQE